MASNEKNFVVKNGLTVGEVSNSTGDFATVSATGILQKRTATETRNDIGAAAASHSHGNITNAGAIGSTSNLVVTTTTSGVLTTSSRSGIDSRSTFPAASHTHGNITNAGAIGSTADLVAVTTTSGVLTTASRSGIDSRSTFPAAAHTHTTTDITNLSSYTGLDARYYTESEIDGFTVKLTGNQTIAGEKTFSASLLVDANDGGTSFPSIRVQRVGTDTSTYQMGVDILAGGGSRIVRLKDGTPDSSLTFNADDIRSSVSIVPVTTNTGRIGTASNIWLSGYFTDLTATTFTGALSGNATSATSAATWTTGRTLTIGSTGKSVNGSANVSWSLAEIGAAATSHTHTLDSLSNTTITSNSSGELLMWNGSAWINRTLTEADLVARTGGTFTGAVAFSTSSTWENNAPNYFRESGGTARIGIYMDGVNRLVLGGTSNATQIHSSITPVYFNGTTTYDIYHEGNLPTGPQVDTITASTYTVQASDDGRTKRLDVTGNFEVTLPDNLSGNIQVAFIGIVTGAVTVTAGGTATIFPSSQEVVSGTSHVTAFSFLHEGSGDWILLTGLLSEPKAKIITVATSSYRLLTLIDDGAIVELNSSSQIEFDDDLPPGWGVDLVYVAGSGSASIDRATGHSLYGPQGDQAFYMMGDQWLGASAYSRGGDEIVLLGAVAGII